MPFLPFSHIIRLRKELRGTGAEVSTWGCDNYDDRIKQWSETCDVDIVSNVYDLLFRVLMFQGAVVRISSVEEVAVVVRFSADRRVPLAVKGGGYSTGGYSSAKGGIVLDMSNLRRVHVEPASHMVIAEGGALWDDIDVAAAQYDLAVVGSTLGHIGAAGATLGEVMDGYLVSMAWQLIIYYGRG